jgi:hypothetical protein
MGHNNYMTKVAWQEIAQVSTVREHMKELAEVALDAMGLDITKFSVSGKRGPTSTSALAKPKLPDEVFSICKSIIFHYKVSNFFDN